MGAEGLSATGRLDATIVVRSAGERTEAACRRLLERQLPKRLITVIREKPFAAALRRSYEIGLEIGCTWTLCIDADVLVSDDAVSRLMALALESDESVAEIQCYVLDRLFGVPRAAGNHLYRTALLEHALRCIPSPGTSLRPESFVLRLMAAEGFPWIQDEAIIGLHDYEQYYRDIYRKAFLHARKHGGYLPYLARLWRRLAASHPDYRVALWGLRSGLAHEGSVDLDVDDPAFADVDRLLSDYDWLEKAPLAPSAISEGIVADMVAQHKPPPEYEMYVRLRDVPRGGLAAIRPMISYVQAALRVVGWPASARWLVRSGGRGLQRAFRRGSAGREGQL